VYQSQKPVTASNSDYVDDDGKYTTEGIAATVRPSIVEIYTYSDMHHQNLLGTGSGIVISKDGYIVTNAHVLQSDGYHTIITSDDEVYDAKIIGRDSKTDIAIIKVSGVELSPATLGDSDEVVVGEQVMAIGNPAGLSGSVTDGIVSAVNRKIRSDSTGFEMNCIQTNADISPGNSGGALVNMYGQVIGITSSKYVSSSYEGLGFAITINDALPIIEELINQGYISGRFRIGIQLIDMSSEYNIAAIQNDLGYELPEDFLGVYISEISDDCDISNTKLKVSDFITAINGKTISTYDELYDTISSMYGAGDTVPATCANVDKDGNITYYEIEFKLMEDTSGDF
jgi:serine protease Do